MKKIRAGIFIALFAMVFTTTPVFADTADPDATPTLVEVNNWRNVLETGDWFQLIYANIPYATPPTTPVTETFVWRLLDGAAELGNTLGSAYNQDGYGYNVYSMYWSEAEVTALGMVWLSAYTLRLSGNPAVFDTPPTYNYLLGTDYSALIDTDEVKVDISARIIFLANDLNSKWGLGVALSLLTQNETATVLSIYGEAFFRGAIYGLQAMAPYAFSVVIRAIDVSDRTWTDNYSTSLAGQYAGTWIETAQEAGKALFGTSYDLLSVIMLLFMSGFLMVGNVMLTGDHWNGFIDVAFLGVVGARLGMFDLAFLILIAALCWIYIAAKVWFGMIR